MPRMWWSHISCPLLAGESGLCISLAQVLGMSTAWACWAAYTEGSRCSQIPVASASWIGAAILLTQQAAWYSSGSSCSTAHLLQGIAAKRGCIDASSKRSVTNGYTACSVSGIIYGMRSGEIRRSGTNMNATGLGRASTVECAEQCNHTALVHVSDELT